MIRTLRCISIVATAISIVALSIRLHATLKQDTRCNEIVSIDSKNLRIEMPNGGAVQLKNGTAFSSDAGEGGESKDWEINLVQDEIIRPIPGQALRLIKLFSNHLTGSGAWDHVFIFRCVKGKVVRVFQKSFLYGVKIQKITDAELIFTSGEWMKGDPMCCPSKETISTYRWSPKDGIFKVVRSVLRPVQIR